MGASLLARQSYFRREELTSFFCRAVRPKQLKTRNMASDMGEDEVDEVFRGVSMALMSDEGRLRRVHDSTVALEVCPRQYEAQIRVVKGALSTIPRAACAMFI